jgi:hypothetical protein
VAFPEQSVVKRGMLAGLSFVSGWLVVIVSGWLSPAIANMANPFVPGDIVTEPWADVATFDILHEDLVFDVRPWVDRAPANIQATYQIHNPGDATAVDLLFVAPGLETGQVTLDGGQAIAATQTATPPIPDEWKIDDQDPIPHGLQFTVPLSPGEHAIAVQYTARPSSDNRHTYRDYTLDYWLSPARQWRSFGSLMVEVWTPPGWQTEVSPPLEPQGNQHWQSTFAELPSDRLTLHTYPVVHPVIRLFRWSLIGIGLGLAFWIAWQLYRGLGQVTQRRQWSQRRFILAGFLLIPLSIPLFLTLLGLGFWAAESLLDGRHLASTYGYGRLFFVFLGGSAGAAIAPITAILAYLTGRKAKVVH